MVKIVTPVELGDKLRSNDAKPLVIDVREPYEYAICHIDGSVNIPMGEIASRIVELDPSEATIVICHHDFRSMNVAVFLVSQGFDDVANLDGGIEAWAAEVDPTMPRY
jgi:rhodanese-related sulfurtransferase